MSDLWGKDRQSQQWPRLTAGKYGKRLIGEKAFAKLNGRGWFMKKLCGKTSQVNIRETQISQKMKISENINVYPLRSAD
jgi:hypothetical protein